MKKLEKTVALTLYEKPSIEVIELQSEGILCLSVLGQGTGEGNQNGFENEDDNENNIW